MNEQSEDINKIYNYLNELKHYAYNIYSTANNEKIRDMAIGRFDVLSHLLIWIDMNIK